MILLFSPEKLLKDGMILHSFEINKTATSISYELKELSKGELQKKIPMLAKDTSNLLQVFTQAGISKIKNQPQKQGGSIDFDTVFIRKIHDTIAHLMPFFISTKCYHRITESSRKIKTAVCSFSAQRPVLRFKVTKSNDHLQIFTSVQLPEGIYSLNEFNRYHFFLEKNSEYLLLGYKDFRTLEWLESPEIKQSGRRESDFIKHVLLRLEETYKVDRNDVFDKNLINCDPRSQLMVSELSGSFLLLTPQWIYDGILIEGPYKEIQDVIRNGNTYSIKRNLEQECHFIELLKGLHPSFDKQPNGYFFLTFDEAKKKQWFLEVYHRLLELNVCLAGMDLLRHFRYSEHKAETDFQICEENENELRIRLQVRFGDEEIPLIKLQRILLGNQHHLLLKDDKIAILDESWLQKYATIIKHGRIRDNAIFVERWLAITQHDKGSTDQLLKPVFNEKWWEQWELWQTDELCTPVPPIVELAELRQYQQKGYEWLVLLANAGAGACLADDMGLGKTLQTICFLANRLEANPGMKHLVVCPSSLIYNWQQELKKFTPGLRVLVYHGAGRRSESLTQTDAEIIITSYGTMRADIEHLCKTNFCVAVLDESHNIKNPYALVTQAALRLRARTRVALSGTPVMNNTFDLYSQLNFLLPGLFGSRDFFKQQYSDPIDLDNDAVKTKALRKLTAPFILRRTKDQVAADLPAKTELTLWCDMNSLQMEQYEVIRDSIRNSIFLEIQRDGLNKSKLSIIQGITRLRQVCNSPLLLPAEERICEDSVKTEVLIDELKNNLKDHKVLVFSQFTKMLNLLKEEMEGNEISFFHFDGQTPPHKRMEMVQAFQEEENTTNVFLISLMAGNTGLNLTAADYVFLFDPWWNNAVQQQAIDRTHRIGQTKNVFAYKMACRDTIEEKIIHLQERKKALSEELIGGEDGFVKNLTIEDVEYLFK